MNSLIKIVFVGHVDHGKSSLIGRLLFETGSLLDGQKESVQQISNNRGKKTEWAFLLDAFQAERDQGITIDTSQVFFRWKERHFIVVDAPGHKEFIKNMVSGASDADAAVLVIDANEGVCEQTRRHSYLLGLLGIKDIIVCINKMDLVGFSQERYLQVKQDIAEYLAKLGLTPNYVIPVSAAIGENIICQKEMPWYEAESFISALARVETVRQEKNNPLRVAIQDVYKFDEKRIIVGKVLSGTLSAGDQVEFSPSGKQAEIQSLECWNAKEPLLKVHKGSVVGFTLSEELFLESGEILSHQHHLPCLTNVFKANIFWFAPKPLSPQQQVTVEVNGLSMAAQIVAINYVVNIEDLKQIQSSELSRHAIGEVVFRTRKLFAADDLGVAPVRFVIKQDYNIAGGGVISLQGYPDQRLYANPNKNVLSYEISKVTTAMRNKMNGHQGGVLWLTGLSGAGKSTISRMLENRLFVKGYHVYILDGDNLRHGLCSDLGFSPNERSENIRRISEVAALLADAGFLVITALISPFLEDRKKARKKCPNFHEIYVKASLEECQRRDPKGLYSKVAKGELVNFTGVGSVYEEPAEPDLILDTERMPVQESVDMLSQYAEANFCLCHELELMST